MEIIILIIGLALGGVISYLIMKPKLGKEINDESLNELKNTVQRLSIQVNTEQEKVSEREERLNHLKKELELKELHLSEWKVKEAELRTLLQETQKHSHELAENLTRKQEKENTLNTQIADVTIAKNNLQLEKGGLEKQVDQLKNTVEDHAQKLEEKNSAVNQLNEQLATFKANNRSLAEKLETQKREMEELRKQFNLEFTNIANKILEEKTEKFTDVNQKSIDAILKPLNENIEKFKKRVDEVYQKEAEQRFSLGEKVKEMARLNQIMSEEARNLTTALKGEAKTQGNWGEMILESILEKSGLRKNEEYFIEHQLVGEDGKPLRSESENKKMRPDAVIKYPDDRTVIIDSKVSLNAFTRYLATTDKELQDQELNAHISAIKNHIISLSAKGYDDYDKALDFVMMFVPSEPAYIAALQGEPGLWEFAYEKRILLMNPTNLITSLKLIVDLWKREYQNRNANEIAERGAKLYDKFVGFVSNLEAVGNHLERAQGKYSEAYKQLYTGNDNLVRQVTKLKKLGVKNKKSLPANLESLGHDEEE